MARRRLHGVAQLASVVGAAGVAMGLLSGLAGASIVGSTSLKLTGAGKGSLHEGASGLCTDARGSGVDLIGLQGAISNFKNAKTWSLVVLAPSAHSGTYAISSSGNASGQLDPMVAHATPVASEKSILNASAGKFTFTGEKGTLDVTFGTGRKAVTVKGSWNCGA